ncbi:Uncharacterised protein [Serratia fonticola]|uniref:Uncharacterized protein n=1 Tax=Serratia fonticola TaxID=47917 RepID=A0A3S5AF57_SERFO|nr:Uncharacterised protein [Serratia fonticola]
MKPLHSYNILNLIVVTFIPSLALAQQPDAAATAQLIDEAKRPPFTQGAAMPTAQHNAPTTAPQPEHRMLPIWGMRLEPAAMSCQSRSVLASTT